MSFLLLLYTSILSHVTLTSATSGGDFTQTEKDSILSDHNTERQTVAQGNKIGYNNFNFPAATNMVQLIWDDSLAAIAKTQAETCVYQHATSTERANRMTSSANIIYVGQSIGENIALQSHSAGVTMDDTVNNIAVLANLIDAWLDNEAARASFSATTTTNLDDLLCATTSNVPSCKHWTQGIWANTRFIGCGFKDCPTTTGKYYDQPWTYLVCNYFPAGNVNGQDVYTSGSTCTSGSCPTFSSTTCNSNGLCVQQPYTAPTACTNECIKIEGFPSNYPYNGVYTCAGVDPDDGYQIFEHNGYTLTKEWNGNNFGLTYYFLTSGNNNANLHAYCAQNSITDCTAGQWSTSGVAASTSSCPYYGAENNDEIKISMPLKSEDASSNSIESNVFNMTEMHVILGLLIVVLIIMCGLIIAFGYYVKKNKENKNLNENKPQHEMVYFENQNIDEQNTPTIDTVGVNGIEEQVQQSLKINVNGTATMVTKLPTTTPVTPLINVDQNYE